MTPIYFIERWFVDESGNLISEAQQLLDVVTDFEQINLAHENGMIRRLANKEISKAALAKEHLEAKKKLHSIRPTVKMKAVSG